RSLRKRERWPLERQQLLLALQSARVSGKRSVGADDPMTRNDNAQRIASGCGAYGARTSRMTDAQCKRRISGRLAPRNLRNRIPHVALKRRSVGRKRDIEALARSGKIFIELPA